VRGFGDVRLSAFRCDRQRTQEYALGTLWKLFEIPECRLDPRNGPGSWRFSYRQVNVVIYDNGRHGKTRSAWLSTTPIEARARAGLTQEQVAQRINNTQAVVARLEGGGSVPSTRTLGKYAKATGMQLKISFEPEGARP
jgi:DNA-binding XRE family transcriptional regulator